MIGNAAAGYRLVWNHWRPVLAVLLPIVAPALIALAVLDLVLGRDHTVIVNYIPTVRDDRGPVVAWVKLAAAALFWLLALAAGALAAIGAARGHALRPAKVIWSALRHLPLYAIGMCSAAGATFLALWLAAGLAGAIGGGIPGVILLLGTLLAVAVVLARVLVGVIAYELGGSGWWLTHGRVMRTAGAFLLGGVVVPLVLADLGDRLLTIAAVPGAAQVVRAIGLTALLAAQAGILAHIYLLPRESVPSSEDDTADLAKVDALLAELSDGRPPRLPWLAMAATMVAVLAAPGVAVANPFGATTVRAHGDAPGEVAAVAWPAGQHPVLATESGARFCDNDVCDRYVTRTGGPVVMGGRGTAGISADGSSVVTAALTGGRDDGGPFIHYATCTREGCREARLPVRTSAKEPFGWPELAVAVAPDRAVWFALAMPVADDRPGKATYRITLIRCAEVGCVDPPRHDAGSVQRIVDHLPGDATPDQQRARLSISADGRPLLTLQAGGYGAASVTCATVTCAAPLHSWTFASGRDTNWAAPTTPTGQVVSIQPGQLRIGHQMVMLLSDEIKPWSGAVVVGGSHIYATAAEATTPPGLHLTVGTSSGREQPRYWQQVLWRCDGLTCRRQILDAFETTAGHERMAVSADGRILLVRQDRILLISAPD